VDYAKDLRSGKIVAAKDASKVRAYVCARPGCGGRVYLPHVVVQRPHFRHYPGEGTPACDEYHPGLGYGGDKPARQIAAVEEDPCELGLLLAQVDGRWGLGLRLPEIPREELGELSVSALRPALIDIYSGSERIVQVSALDLRPGVGVARVDVVPTLERFRTQPSGSWPDSIHKERWLLESRGLRAKGALFRLRRGEWMRLLEGSGVHHAEALLVLADGRCAPPKGIVSQTHHGISGGGSQWTIWEVRLPSVPVADVIGWLAQLGHEFVPRSWGLDFATPPRAYAEQGIPVFWLDDAPVVTLEAPQPSAEAHLLFKVGSILNDASVEASATCVAHARVRASDVGNACISIAAEQSSSVDLVFVPRPHRTALLEMLTQTPRLRIWIGDQEIAAWGGSTHKVFIASREIPEVRIDFGADSVRARVKLWERGKQRSSRGLNARNTARLVEAALSTGSRVEIDADNLGRLQIVPTHVVPEAPSKSASSRLAWHDHVLSLRQHHDEATTPSFLEQPRTASSLTSRMVTPAELVRSRMVLRRHGKKGDVGP